MELLITEVTMRQLRTGIDGKILKRAEPVTGRLVSLSPDGILTFFTSSVTTWPGQRDSWTQHIKLVEWGIALQLRADGANFMDMANLALFGDVKVSCNCPSFMFHGYRYILTQLDALYIPSPMHDQWADDDAGGGEENRPPQKRNPDLEGVVCKHLSTALYISTMSVSKIAGLLKEMARTGELQLPTAKTKPVTEPETPDNPDTPEEPEKAPDKPVDDEEEPEEGETSDEETEGRQRRVRPVLESVDDEVYAAAVEAGDMELCQTLVDAAAKAAGYTELVFKGYRRTDDSNQQINVIQRQETFPTFGGEKPTLDGIAGFFSSEEATAQRFADMYLPDSQAVNKFYLNLGRLKVIDAGGSAAGNVQFGKEGREFQSAVESGEYDTILLADTSDEGDVFVTTKSNQSKLANPITYDDAGEIIPLSRRFNTGVDDIREGRKTDEQEP